MSSISESSFQDFGQPIAVGMVSTEGEKLLKALRKIQYKLKDNHQKHEKSGKKSLDSGIELKKSEPKEQHNNYAMSGSGDHRFKPDNWSQHRCPEPVICNHKSSDDLNSQLIETRLKLIETQLKNISMQLMSNNSAKNPVNSSHRHKHMDQTYSEYNTHKKLSPLKNKTRITTEDQTATDDKYEASITAIKKLVKSHNNQKISKSVSLDGINNRYNPSKHFHLQYKDIPFILGTNCSKSYSVIANRQMEISRLKQHNPLCTDRIPTRKILDQKMKTTALENEIKELLQDLHEEHNYICEEIQYLSKQLERITDPNRKIDFNRELYFLSRRILSKKRQINELQELHAIVGKNSLNNKSNESVVIRDKSIVEQKLNNRLHFKNKTSNESIPKWI